MANERQRFSDDQQGIAIIETALCIALISFGVIGGVTAFGSVVNTRITKSGAAVGPGIIVPNTGGQGELCPPKRDPVSGKILPCDPWTPGT